MDIESTNIGARGIERACRGKGYTMQYFYEGFPLPVVSIHKYGCTYIYKHYILYESEGLSEMLFNWTT